MTTRVAARPTASLALLSVIVACCGGCSSGGTDSAKPNQGDPNSRRILADMGQPDLALVVSGQLDGYLEPCGCSKGKAGGLVRRYELVERLRAQNWPVALIDLGGLIGDPAGARGGTGQSMIKLRYILKAFGLMKYDALAVNVDDLKVGVKEALAIYRDNRGQTTTVVAANVKAAKGFEAHVRPSVTLTVGHVRLGVTAVIDPASLAKLVDPDKDTLLPEVKSPDEVLPAILSELELESDYQVLMVDGTFEFATSLAQANPGFDVVVAASDSPAPRSRRPDILNDGATTLVSIGRRGFNVGVFAFSANQSSRRPTYRLVTLDDQYDVNGTEIETLIHNDYRAALKAAGVVERGSRHNASGHPGAAFIGAAACATCHPNTYQRWSTTRHAQAFASLLHDRRPNTAFDAECVTCHTTGFPYVSGWRSEAATAYLAGNQCENCHGPGSKHAADPDNIAFLQHMIRTTAQAQKKLCYQCHDHDNSPDFDFTRYWSQIAHKGLDEYKEPKVHHGVAVKDAVTRERAGDR